MRKCIAISIEEKLVEKIDSERGLVNRSRWIEHELELSMKKKRAEP
jgi:metal-responsive CopG/Arc/MetJ family transcriptional regulator